MRCEIAEFFLVEGEHDYRVRFELGGDKWIVVEKDAKPVSWIDNRDNTYRPCVTHCVEILKTLNGDKPKTAFAARRLSELRRKGKKTRLSIVGKETEQ